MCFKVYLFLCFKNILKKVEFFFIFYLLQIIFLMFLNHFDVMCQK